MLMEDKALHLECYKCKVPPSSSFHPFLNPAPPLHHHHSSAFHRTTTTLQPHIYNHTATTKPPQPHHHNNTATPTLPQPHHHRTAASSWVSQWSRATTPLATAPSSAEPAPSAGNAHDSRSEFISHHHNILLLLLLFYLLKNFTSTTTTTTTTTTIISSMHLRIGAHPSVTMHPYATTTQASLECFTLRKPMHACRFNVPANNHPSFVQDA